MRRRGAALLGESAQKLFERRRFWHAVAALVYAELGGVDAVADEEGVDDVAGRA